MRISFEHHAREAWHVLEQKRAGRAAPDTIGLVVQGGAMRGVYSMGALAALEEMGFHQSFDHVAGSSAGALNAAYFLTGQANYGVQTYVHYLTKKQFVNPLRIKKMVDIDFLVDHIGKKIRPLDMKKLIAAKTLLHISLTEYSNGKTHYVTNKTPGIDLWEAFRAAAAIPILYNKPVRLGKRLYVDGSLRARLPIKRVVDHGCHYVVVVMTRLQSHRANSRSPLFKTLSWLATRHYSEGLRQALYSEDAEYNATKTHLSRTNPTIPGVPVKLVVIAPKSIDDLVSTVTTDPTQLMQSALKARAETYNAFGKVPPPMKYPFAR